jgi:hypothetical protein
MEESGPMIGVDCIVHDKWKIIELIAQGGFGSIFKGICLSFDSSLISSS